MEIKKIEKSDLVLFPRLQEQGVESRHVEREAFRAELRHVEGHGDYWLLHQQAKPHVVVNIQFAADEAEFDRKLGWFIGQQKLHEYVRGDLSFGRLQPRRGSKPIPRQHQEHRLRPERLCPLVA